MVAWMEFIKVMKCTFRLIRISELIYFVDDIILLTRRTIIANIKFQVGIYIHTVHSYKSLDICIVSYPPAPFLNNKIKLPKKMVGEGRGNQQGKPKRSERKFFHFHLFHYQLSLKLTNTQTCQFSLLNLDFHLLWIPKPVL